MEILLILLALNAASPDALAFAHCAAAARTIGHCRTGHATMLFYMGGYSSRITLVDPWLHPQGGAVCQPGVESPCEFWPKMAALPPKSWAIDATEIEGTFRYCLTERPRKGHLPVGCLTRADHLVYRHRED